MRTCVFTAAFVWFVALALGGLAQTAPQLTRVAAASAISKNQTVLGNNTLRCPLLVSRVVTTNRWALADAGCGKDTSDFLFVIFEYKNHTWTPVCSFYNPDKALRATYVMRGCG